MITRFVRFTTVFPARASTTGPASRKSAANWPLRDGSGKGSFDVSRGPCKTTRRTSQILETGSAKGYTQAMRSGPKNQPSSTASTDTDMMRTLFTA
jgi:hypothetical protein